MKPPRSAFHVDKKIHELTKKLEAIIGREKQELEEDLPLKERFESLVLEYTEKFYTIMYWEFIDWDNVHWIGGDLGEVCGIGDYFVSFGDMRYVVDNNISGDDYRDWYWQNMPPEEGKKYVNLETYLRLKKI